MRLFVFSHFLMNCILILTKLLFPVTLFLMFFNQSCSAQTGIKCLGCFYSSNNLVSNMPEVVDCKDNPPATESEPVQLPGTRLLQGSSDPKVAALVSGLRQASTACDIQSATSCKTFTGSTAHWGKVVYRTCGTENQNECVNKTKANQELVQVRFLQFYTLMECTCNTGAKCNSVAGFNGDGYVPKVEMGVGVVLQNIPWTTIQLCVLLPFALSLLFNHQLIK